MPSRIENSTAHITTFSTNGTDAASSTQRSHINHRQSNPTGNVIEAFAGSMGAQGAPVDQKDALGAVFNLLGNLFKPQSQAGGQPTFDLGQILTGILGVAETLFAGQVENAARETMGANPTRNGDSGGPDREGRIGTGNARVKIVPGASDGVKGIEDEGQLDLQANADLGGGTTARGGVRGGTFAGARSNSSAGVDQSGNLYAQGGFEAAAGARIRAEGEIQGSWGNVRGGVGAEAQVYARGQAAARLGLQGVDAMATAGVGAMAGANADAEANIGNGLARGAAKAEAKAGTGADATATATATYSPLQAAFKGEAGAFAGARASCEAKGTIAGVGYKVGAEAWAGVGAKAGIDVGLKDGKFKFELTLGIAVGVGACATVGFEIDTKDIFSVARGIIGAAGALLGGILKPVGDAVGAITKPVGDVFGGVFGAVGGLFGGGKGDGSAASGALDLFASLAKTGAGFFGSPETSKPSQSQASSPELSESEPSDDEARPLQDAPLPSPDRAYA